MVTAAPEAEAVSRARRTPVLWSGWWPVVCGPPRLLPQRLSQIMFLLMFLLYLKWSYAIVAVCFMDKSLRPLLLIRLQSQSHVRIAEINSICIEEILFFCY